jgi:hypothetical protein
MSFTYKQTINNLLNILNVNKPIENKLVEVIIPDPKHTLSDALKIITHNDDLFIDIINKYINTDGFIICGGFVMALLDCMMGNNIASYGNTDVDIYCFNDNYNISKVQLHNILKNIVSNFADNDFTFINKDKLFEIIPKNEKHKLKFQFMNNIYENIYDILNCYDLDCVSFVLINNKIYTLANNNVLTTRVNVSDTLLYTRMSIYGCLQRMNKYYKRGFLSLVFNTKTPSLELILPENDGICIISISGDLDKIYADICSLWKTRNIDDLLKYKTESNTKHYVLKTYEPTFDTCTYYYSKLNLVFTQDEMQESITKTEYDIHNFLKIGFAEEYLAFNYGVINSAGKYIVNKSYKYYEQYKSNVFTGKLSKEYAKTYMDLHSDYKILLQITSSKGYRQFVPYKTFEDCYDIIKDQKTYYEVILSNNVCKPYLDIEWETARFENINMVQLIVNLNKTIIEVFKTRFNADITLDNILISSSHKINEAGIITKCSFHIVIDSKYVFQTNKKQYGSCTAYQLYILLIEFRDRFKHFMDGSVYSTDREFRLLYSSKFNENRKLIPVDNITLVELESSKVNMKRYFITYFDNDYIVLK